MNILTKLTAENLKKNPRRTIMTIIGTMLSTALILAVAGMVSSMHAMMIDYTKQEVGDYHDMFEGVTAEALPIIENNPHAKIQFMARPITENKDIDESMLDYYATYENTPYQYADLQLIDEPVEKTNVFVRYDNPRDYQSVRASIQDSIENQLEEYVPVRTNKEMLRYEGVMSDTTLNTLYSLMAVVILIIIVTSVFAIRNSFSISANERTRQFGMLGSIGATPKQIRRSVITEGMMVAAIGIPLGIICGLIAVLILVAVINFLLGDMMVGVIGVSLPLWIFLLAIVLGIVTIFFSTLMPAIRAGRMSPVEAMKGAKDYRTLPKKIKTNKLIDATFGIGGTIAHKNLQRSRKKYRTTVISIVVAVATFVGLTSFMSMMNKSTSYMYGNTNLDLAVSGATPAEVKEYIERFNFTDYAYYNNADTLLTAVSFMDAESFEEYAKANGVKDDFDNAVILYGRMMTLADDGHYIVESSDYKPGDKEQIMLRPQNIEADCEKYEEYCYPADKIKKVEVEITNVTETPPLGYEDHYGEMFILSENSPLKSKLTSEEYVNLVVQNYKDVDKAYEQLKEIADQKQKENGQNNKFYVMNIHESIRANRNVVVLVGIFLYGFLTVITLIGVTNIFNVITTNIALRAKELAMLRSIGMTRKELNRMVRLESVFYTVKSLLIGLPLGVLISWLFFMGLENSIEFAYQVPWLACVIATIAVMILIFCIMKYSVRQVEKQNIIETLREENI